MTKGFYVVRGDRESWGKSAERPNSSEVDYNQTSHSPLSLLHNTRLTHSPTHISLHTQHYQDAPLCRA